MNLRKAHNKRFNRTQVIKVVTLGVLIIGLLFGLQQVQTNQDIKKSKASYCGLCSPNGDCECANDKQTGNKCKYAPPECSNLGNTWQPDSGCTANAACGTGGGGGGGGELIPTPTSTSWSCTGRKPTTSCSNCGGNNQSYCGTGNNSTTCNCNSNNNPCDQWYFSYAGYCKPFPSAPTPTPFGGVKGNPKPSPAPTSAYEKQPSPRPKSSPTPTTNQRPRP